jgi:hypothetical protein
MKCVRAQLLVFGASQRLVIGVSSRIGTDKAEIKVGGRIGRIAMPEIAKCVEIKVGGRIGRIAMPEIANV